MNNNYEEQLAWYEKTVRPYAVTPISVQTRVWHASAPKSCKPPELTKSSQNTLDVSEKSKPPDQPSLNTRKKESKRSCNWTTDLMTEDEQEDSMASMIEFDVSFCSQDQAEEDISSISNEKPTPDVDVEHQKPSAVMNSVAELRIRSPVLRTMSEDSIYFDALNEMENEASIPVTVQTNDSSKTSNPSSLSLSLTSSSPPQYIIPEQMIEKQLVLFNQTRFIANQLNSILADLDKQDILLVLPSGPARDMCYLLPLTVKKCNLITIVIVPDYATLEEKADNPSFHLSHIRSYFVSKLGDCLKKPWISVAQFQQNIFRMVTAAAAAAAPPPLKKPTVFVMTFDDFSKCKTDIGQLYSISLLSRIILEDAHCISQWGCDFRFQYLKMAENLRNVYPKTSITALTAFSNERVHIDIMNHLKLPHVTTRVFKRSILL